MKRVLKKTINVIILSCVISLFQTYDYNVNNKSVKYFQIKTAKADDGDKISRMRCNLNSECRPGFVCVGGKGAYATTSKQEGCCEVILPLRQLCIFHNLMTGIFGRGIIALVVISMGLAGIFGKLGMKSLLAFFVGTVCIFGSYQVVHLLTGYDYQVCELVDTSVVPGKCYDDPDDIANIYNSNVEYEYN